MASAALSIGRQNSAGGGREDIVDMPVGLCRQGTDEKMSREKRSFAQEVCVKSAGKAMMAPFMSCGARLAIFAVFAAAFFGQQGALAVFSLYVLGIVMATAYMDWITGPQGQEHFEQAGFIPAISAKGQELVEKLGVKDVA